MTDRDAPSVSGPSVGCSLARLIARAVAFDFIDPRQRENDEVSVAEDPANPPTFSQCVQAVTPLVGGRVLDLHAPRLPEPAAPFPRSHLLVGSQRLHRSSSSTRFAPVDHPPSLVPVLYVSDIGQTGV